MEPSIEVQQPTHLYKTRNHFIAFLLSLLFPGLGQIYNGQLKKAIIFLGLLLFLPFVFGLTRGATNFYGLATVFTLELALRIIMVVDAIRQARLQQEYIPKPYNTWYYHLFFAVVIIGIFVVTDVTKVMGVQTFKVPTPTNNPTILEGDWLVADLRAYKNTEPGYGDIVVFEDSKGTLSTYRVVGLPNDTIDLTDNIVSINRKASKSTFIKEALSYGISVEEYEEEFPNRKKHLIYKFKQPFDISKTNIKNIVVPPGNYYLLGDNRDNAADSRYEGFVSRDKIKGQIIYSYWGKPALERMNIDFR